MLDVIAVVFLLLAQSQVNAFTPCTNRITSTLLTVQASDADISVAWIDEDDEEPEVEPVEEKIKSSRWDALNPRVKERLVKAGQERAIVNKKKRESDQTKKRSKQKQQTSEIFCNEERFLTD